MLSEEYLSWYLFERSLFFFLPDLIIFLFLIFLTLFKFFLLSFGFNNNLFFISSFLSLASFIHEISLILISLSKYIYIIFILPIISFSKIRWGISWFILKKGLDLLFFSLPRLISPHHSIGRRLACFHPKLKKNYLPENLVKYHYCLDFVQNKMYYKNHFLSDYFWNNHFLNQIKYLIV
jgi:hypothetical protein